MATTGEIIRISLRKGDHVQVIAGRDKGKIGKILDLDFTANTVKVEKVNMVKRHMRATQKNPQGGILEKEAPLHASNVLILCPKCNRGVRHGKRFVEKTDGKKSKGKAKSADQAAEKVKVRVCKRCGETLDVG